MHLTANAETIDRLVDQGALLLQAFHTEHENDPYGVQGRVPAWRIYRLAQYHTHAIPRLRGRNR